MTTSDLLENIMSLLAVVSEDDEKLQKILTFIEEEIINSLDNSIDEEIINKYKDTIPQIVQAIEDGFVCYLNPETLEIEQVSADAIFDQEEFEEQHDDMLDEYDLNYMKWARYIKFEPLDTESIYRLIEDFINEMDDENLASELENELLQQKSYSRIIKKIESAVNMDMWQNFRRNATENYVRNLLYEAMGVNY